MPVLWVRQEPAPLDEVASQYFAGKEADDRHPQGKKSPNRLRFIEMGATPYRRSMSMRRVMLLALLAMALPTTALAGSIFFFTVSSSPEQEQQSHWSGGGTGLPITALAVDLSIGLAS